jgi:hypothetical protein
MSYDMKFRNGPLAGTRLEIMPSKAATTLPDGTPITEMTDDARRLTHTQSLAADGKLDVHARQRYIDLYQGECWVFEGPTIAQQWRSEYNSYRTQQGWRARYYRGWEMGRED